MRVALCQEHQLIFRRSGPSSFRGALQSIDFFLWTLAFALSGLLRYEFQVTEANWLLILTFGSAAGTFHLILARQYQFYGSKYRNASFDELLAIIPLTAATTLPLAGLAIAVGPLIGVPRSLPLIAAPLFLVMSGGFRLLVRISTLRRLGRAQRKYRALVYGAGDMAEALIPRILRDQTSNFLPVGLIDDDPEKKGNAISGVKVLGPFQNLENLVAKTRASHLIVSIPRANSDQLSHIRQRAMLSGVDVSIVPSFDEILAKNSGVKLRELGIEDLVGRRASTVDTTAIRNYLQDRTVLITGAGGSIGVELSRQVAQFKPGRLIFLDRDETGLQNASMATSDSALLDTAETVLADIRDKKSLEIVFSEMRPEIVFHAAALKHLPVLERYPLEAWKTNVIGTMNLLEVASTFGVRRFVNISTDKAAAPTSVLGKSKRLAEQLTAHYSTITKESYISVRFGNVLGSRGSLVPAIAHYIENDLPVIITDPEATRYFMTIKEACQLVLQAGSEAHASAILMLDMGDPVRINDIAERMIELSGN